MGGEILGILFATALVLGVPLLGLIGFFRTLSLRRRVDALEVALHRMEKGEPIATATAAVVPAEVAGPTQVPEMAKPPLVAPEPPFEAPPPPVAPPVAPVAEAPAPVSPVVRPDIATNLGPKIMAAVASLFVVTALAFFVKYAWDNNWVGPAGRVLGSALFSLILFALGVRTLRRQYRPLGQALMAAGLAGLYVVAFAAHGVYQLIPRTASFGMMVAITAASVALAARLDARLLATLAWIGAYLAPVLVSTGEDRAEALFGYLALLALGALVIDRKRSWPETALLAQAGTWLLYGGWFVSHFSRPRCGIAAIGLVAFTALFSLGARKEHWASTVLALLVGSAWCLGFGTQDPMILGSVLLALGVIAFLSVGRFAGALLVTQILGWATVAMWAQSVTRATVPVVVLASMVFVFYLAALLLRSRGTARPAMGPLGGHVLNAVAFWLVLFSQLYPGDLWSLTGATVGLAALYLVLGRLAPRSTPDSRTLLGLGAAFLTAAIPVRLGLNGITVAWALEGILLVWLGLKSKSVLARVGGYVVLGLAVGRLFGRHLPIHADDAFTPVLNASFGVWLFVALALFAAYKIAQSIEGRAERALAGPLMACVAIAILFIGCTAETDASFAARKAIAQAAQDADAARGASLLRGLAISLLWSVFASALLIAGLSLRSRAVFYGAYALFAVAAAKVALVDLAMLQTLYRILSFLALGLLLMVGAFLILKFRHRLEPPNAMDDVP